MIDFENLTRHELDTALLEKIAKSLTQKDIELVLCHNDYIHKLNNQYRGKDCATDVLSFPISLVENAPLGSIVISYDKALDAAKKYGHSLDEEVSLLFIHGILHLLGHDHETDSGTMRQKELEIVAKFNLPASLIVRNY